MKLIRGLHNITDADHGCVLTIGNFDGVHLGHKTVLAELRKKSLELNLPAMLMIFEPHPKEFFTPEAAPARLTNFREKLTLLQQEELGKILLVEFNDKVSKLSAGDFISELLIKKLGVKYLLIGEDFHFGHKRQGNIELLKEASLKYDFQVATVPTLLAEKRRISSTGIREALSIGDFARANELLGYEYSICGPVQYGDQRGRTIGFPTANISLKRLKSPLRGVFAVSVEGLKSDRVRGVANLGTRPTVDGLKTLLEVNLFEFDEEIYGKKIKVIFHRKIRDERKFDSFEELRRQIQKDSEAAKLV